MRNSVVVSKPRAAFHKSAPPVRIMSLAHFSVMLCIIVVIMFILSDYVDHLHIIFIFGGIVIGITPSIIANLTTECTILSRHTSDLYNDVRRLLCNRNYVQITGDSQRSMWGLNVPIYLKWDIATVCIERHEDHITIYGPLRLIRKIYCNFKAQSVSRTR